MYLPKITIRLGNGNDQRSPARSGSPACGNQAGGSAAYQCAIHADPLQLFAHARFDLRHQLGVGQALGRQAQAHGVANQRVILFDKMVNHLLAPAVQLVAQGGVAAGLIAALRLLLS